MLVKRTGTLRERRLRATSRADSSPGSIPAASTLTWSRSPPAKATGSCPSRRTTSSSRALMSSCGSQMRTRATDQESVRAAGIGLPGWYEGRMNARPRVLVVDDDEDIRTLVRELLERAGYTVDEAENGRAALRHLFSSAPALVILDVTMPDLDGYQTLERNGDLSDVPVIMLTARTQELEKVRGLSAGADDYVAKPFGRQELLARVQALLRRTGGKTEVLEAYQDDFTEIDYAQRRVVVQGRDVQLTPLEFKLLAAFVQNPNQILSRDQLLELVWGDPYGVSGDQVKLYVGYLRRKLVPDAPDEAPIETVRGFGYRYRKTQS